MSDPRERFNDPEEAYRTAFEGLIAGTWSALPVEIQSVNWEAQTCIVQVTLIFQQKNEDGSITPTIMKPLVDCPLWIARGGQYCVTMPVAAGDEGLALFADRCIDGWWQNGGIQAQAELRLHSLSDGFVIVGFTSQPNVIPNVNSGVVQIRSLNFGGITGAGECVQIGPGKISLIADEVVIASRLKTNIGAGGCGVQYLPDAVNTFTDGVGGTHSVPTPPEIAE